MPNKLTSDGLVQVMRDLATQGRGPVTSSQLAAAANGSAATVKRLLGRLHADGKVVREGKARATRYSLPLDVAQPLTVHTPPPAGNLRWSAASESLRERLSVPLAAREPVTYQREFVDRYKPNKTWLLPEPLAVELAHLGRMQGQQPAGTYARKVLEQLLIDLSWSSSRLEGNRYSLLATEELFRNGISDGDVDAVMLLNHKSAIEFLVDAVPTQGLSTALIRNLHAVLMQDLLADTGNLGAIRNKVVNISDTAYVPMQVPSILHEMLESIVAKARLIKNSLEAAFFLWVNLACLQPFEDGNKRTSRLAANIPLMLYNCAPLSFLDVDRHDYALAMMGVYEFLDVSMAVDLFNWTYRRSLKKYVVVMESMGAPDPVRLRYRETLNEAIGLVVRERKAIRASMFEMGLTEETAPGFSALLVDELAKLEPYNCARYRLTMSTTDAWIAAGRPQ
ncbi:Fic family protein [Paraburkholderia sp. GAS42]|jgi:Fic family protein|uniref:Fic family protein n=1 Tax=Paraburkholderia sp. GAS42 TaxID=3035135 RepID=UPI003D207076